MKKFYNFNIVPKMAQIPGQGPQPAGGNPGLSQISSKEFASKFKSKRECYTFLAQECDVYLPPFGKCLPPLRLTFSMLQTTPRPTF